MQVVKRLVTIDATNWVGLIGSVKSLRDITWHSRVSGRKGLGKWQDAMYACVPKFKWGNLFSELVNRQSLATCPIFLPLFISFRAKKKNSRSRTDGVLIVFVLRLSTNELWSSLSQLVGCDKWRSRSACSSVYWKGTGSVYISIRLIYSNIETFVSLQEKNTLENCLVTKVVVLPLMVKFE